MTGKKARDEEQDAEVSPTESDDEWFGLDAEPEDSRYDVEQEVNER